MDLFYKVRFQEFGPCQRAVWPEPQRKISIKMRNSSHGNPNQLRMQFLIPCDYKAIQSLNFVLFQMQLID